jgi:hypothetical protein
MRALFAICAIVLLSSCRLSLDAVLAPLDCGGDGGYHHQSSSCSGVIPGPIVIVIGPSRQYSDPSDALCYQVSPVTATVKVGESYTFQNSTSSMITIQGADQSTWTSVAASSTSAALTFSAAGTYSFGVQGCRGVSGTAWYGQLNVTQ